MIPGLGHSKKKQKLRIAKRLPVDSRGRGKYRALPFETAVGNLPNDPLLIFYVAQQI